MIGYVTLANVTLVGKATDLCVSRKQPNITPQQNYINYFNFFVQSQGSILYQNNTNNGPNNNPNKNSNGNSNGRTTKSSNKSTTKSSNNNSNKMKLENIWDYGDESGSAATSDIPDTGSFFKL